jgi:hypothetical protein
MYSHEQVTGRKTVSPLALEFEGPSSPFDSIGEIFDGIQMIDFATTIAGTAAGETVLLGVGIVTTVLGPWIFSGGMAEGGRSTNCGKKRFSKG